MMTDDDDEEIRRQLIKLGFTEAYQVLAEYTCLRQTETGALQELRVQVRDAGPLNRNGRFSLRVWIPSEKERKAEDERIYVLGNSAESIYAAASRLHWRTLESWLATDAR